MNDFQNIPLDHTPGKAGIKACRETGKETRSCYNAERRFDGLKAALYLGSMRAKSNTASGMPVCLWREGIGSRSSGKERDVETGLDYFLARYFSAPQGRFMRPDPILIHPDRLAEPQRLNLYVYARNNPLKYVDPNGLDDIIYDQAGNEIKRKKRSKWHNFFFGDSWKMKADSGKTYDLDSVSPSFSASGSGRTR